MLPLVYGHGTLAEGGQDGLLILGHGLLKRRVDHHFDVEFNKITILHIESAVLH